MNTIPTIIYSSRSFKKIMDQAFQVAPSSSTLLITGDTGTGKELVARMVHASGPRAKKPFIKINCGAIPENLLEAELFGYEKGAFTGAHTSKKGKLELASGGTLFLDEVGELSLAMQVKILHVLQHGQFERVGGTVSLKSDVRFIAATNIDLEKKLKEHQFRQDLYYRIHVISIHLPALRDHREDIPALVNHFTDMYSRLNNKNINGIEPRVIKQMMKYPWFGNIRELENMIERAVVLSTGPLLNMKLFPLLSMPSDAEKKRTIHVEIGSSLEIVERQVILRTLEYFNFDKQKTARSLEIGPATLYRKLEKYKLEEITESAGPLNNMVS